jgi:hypothetical protein
LSADPDDVRDWTSRKTLAAATRPKPPVQGRSAIAGNGFTTGIAVCAAMQQGDTAMSRDDLVVSS